MHLDTSKPALSEIGAYDVLAKVAEGGMGTVYKARRREDGQVVAIKIIPPTAARNAILLQRFKREFNAARQIDHPNVVKALEFCEQPPSPYLVMEFVDGESLGQRIEREGKVAEAEAIDIMTQVCQGLHRAHRQGMIHRDIKPDNILLAAKGVAKITDLGLVKDIEGEMNLTRTGRGLGTPHFMAPEQFRNAKNADVRCDVYSLGATLYMAVTGKMPFDGCGPLDAWMKKSNNEFPAPRDIAPNLSEQINRAILRAMNSDPEMRPASCREFVEELLGQAARPKRLSPSQTGDLWYMVYRDDDGATHTVKGTTENIRKAFGDGLLGDASNIRASRSKQGPFRALDSYAEFRDMVHGDASTVVVAGPLTARAPAEIGTNTPPPTARPTASDDSDDAIAPYVPKATPTPSSTATGHDGPDNSLGARLVNWLIWGAIVVAAVALGVISVLLLK